MNKTRLVIVGGVAAGTKAASKARRENPDWEIIVLTRDQDVSYAGCGLPYFVGGIIKERHELVVRGPEEFEADQNIVILTRREVIDLSPEEKTVTFRELETGKEHSIPYDYLIIATGASPFFPPIEGIRLQNILPLRTVTDAEAMRDLVESCTVKEAVVVGAGFIGLEVAENLTLKGIKVTVLEMVPLILPGYDEELSLFIKNYLIEQGIEVLTGVKVEGFNGDEAQKVQGVRLGDGQIIPAQLVVWAGGVRPNTEMAKKASLEVGTAGHILVNEYQETSHKDIYAVGDCTLNKHLITGQSAWFPLGSTANKAGRIAGVNVGKGQIAQLPGVLGTSVIKLFELSAARTGLTEKQAQEQGYKAVSVVIPGDDRAHYYPGHRQIITKLIADAETQKVLGVQVVGEGIVDKPVDIIATLITCGGDLKTLSRLDLAYAPPFSMAIGSVILAANVLLNKIHGEFKGINARDLQPLLENGEVVVLDIRTEAEHFLRAIPGSLNIPHHEIECRLQEIPKDKKVVLVCQVGRRAYINHKAFEKMGLDNSVILEGGIEAYPYTLE